MPTYDYACCEQAAFEAFRTLASRNELADCPDCGSASPRVFVSAPRLTSLPATPGAPWTSTSARPPRAPALQQLPAPAPPGWLRLLLARQTQRHRHGAI